MEVDLDVGLFLTSIHGKTLAKAEGGPANIETSFKTARE